MLILQQVLYKVTLHKLFQWFFAATLQGKKFWIISILEMTNLRLNDVT